MAFTEVISQNSSTIVKTGASATPVGGTDDLLTTGNPVVFQPNVAKITRRNHGSSFTKRKSPTGVRYWDIVLEFALQGSGSAGSAAVNGFAAIDALLRASAMTVSSPASNLVYAPSTISTLEPCTIWNDLDGTLHKATDCVGNLTLEGNPQDVLLATWTGRGTYAEPTLGTISGFTGGTDRSDAFLNIGGTITPSGGSAYTECISRFRFDRGIQLSQIPDAGSVTGLKKNFIGDAIPTMSIDIAIDKDGSANLTYPQIYNHLMGGTVHDVDFTLGSTPNAITFAATESEVANLRLSDADNYVSGTLDYNVVSDTNEGEFSITIA